jgi:hypothetical protein
MGVPAGKDEIPLSHMVGTLGRPSKTQFIAPIVLRRPAEHHIKRPDWPGKRAEIKGVRQVHSATSEKGHFAALIRGGTLPIRVLSAHIALLRRRWISPPLPQRRMRAQIDWLERG